jgi:hypothetical protein
MSKNGVVGDRRLAAGQEMTLFSFWRSASSQLRALPARIVREQTGDRAALERRLGRCAFAAIAAAVFSLPARENPLIRGGYVMTIEPGQLL